MITTSGQPAASRASAAAAVVAFAAHVPRETDGLIVAAFADPGCNALRAQLAIAAVGIAEAAIGKTAGRRFAVATTRGGPNTTARAVRRHRDLRGPRFERIGGIARLSARPCGSSAARRSPTHFRLASVALLALNIEALPAPTSSVAATGERDAALVADTFIVVALAVALGRTTRAAARARAAAGAVRRTAARADRRGRGFAAAVVASTDGRLAALALEMPVVLVDAAAPPGLFDHDRPSIAMDDIVAHGVIPGGADAPQEAVARALAAYA